MQDLCYYQITLFLEVFYLFQGHVCQSCRVVRVIMKALNRANDSLSGSLYW